jgi:hypothetical protein
MYGGLQVKLLQQQVPQELLVKKFKGKPNKIHWLLQARSRKGERFQ